LRSYGIYQLSDEKVKVDFRGNGGDSRKIALHVGDTIFVQPDNPNKLKHRGRKGIIKGFIRDDIGNVVMAKVQFMDTKRPGKVDLQDIVLKEAPVPEAMVEPHDLTKPRYLPEAVPDSLFTKSELSRRGLVPIYDKVAFVKYPEQRREYKLFSIEQVREQKRQESSLRFRSVTSKEEVLKRREHAIQVRKEQLNMHCTENS